MGPNVHSFIVTIIIVAKIVPFSSWISLFQKHKFYEWKLIDFAQISCPLICSLCSKQANIKIWLPWSPCVTFGDTFEIQVIECHIWTSVNSFYRFQGFNGIDRREAIDHAQVQVGEVRQGFRDGQNWSRRSHQSDDQMQKRIKLRN